MRFMLGVISAMNDEHDTEADKTGWRWLNPDMGWSTVLHLGPLLVGVIVSLIVAILKWLA